MRKTETGLSLSATDVSNSLVCRQLTGLDMRAVLEGRERPFRNDPLGDILRDAAPPKNNNPAQGREACRAGSR